MSRRINTPTNRFQQFNISTLFNKITSHQSFFKDLFPFFSMYSNSHNFQTDDRMELTLVPYDVELNNDRMELTLVPNDVELNNDRMELTLVPNDVELNNDRMELTLVPNDVELPLISKNVIRNNGFITISSSIGLPVVTS